MIKCLPGDVQALLRSGLATCSMAQCLEELLLNSIDAGAFCVAVRVDIEAGKIQVVDNGQGMDRNDLENVGKRYFTSKCNNLRDLENLKCYGFRGEAIASITSVANVVEISSRVSRSPCTFVRVFKDGKPLEVYEAPTTRPSSGTTVTVINLFYNLPVRRKNTDPVLECERMRQKMEAISLMHPLVSFTLKNNDTGATIVQLSKSGDTYHRFTQIYGLAKAQKLGEVDHVFKQFEVTGHIGREGHYNSSIQFVFVNGRLVLKTKLHKLINFLLKKMSVICRQKGSPKQGASVKSKASTDLFGVYIINIKCHCMEYDICLEPAKTLIEFRDWDSVMACLEEGVKRFLTRENLITELSSTDLTEFNEENNVIGSSFHAYLADKGNAISEIGKSYEIKSLDSKAVRRPLPKATDVTSQLTLKPESPQDGCMSVPVRKKSECSPALRLDMDKDKTMSKTHSSETKSTKNHTVPYIAAEVSEGSVNLGLLENVNDESNLCSNIPVISTIQQLDTVESIKKRVAENSGLCEKKVNESDDANTDVSQEYFCCNVEQPIESEIIWHEASNPCLSTVRLCSTDVLNCQMSEGSDSIVCDTQEKHYRLGPTPARDIFRAKQTSVKEQELPSKSGSACSKQPLKDSSLSEWQKCCSQSDDIINKSASQVSHPELKKTLANLSAETNISIRCLRGASDASECNITRPPKLSLPVTTGSLDRFKMFYGKMSLSGLQIHHQSNNNSDAPHRKRANKVEDAISVTSCPTGLKQHEKIGSVTCAMLPVLDTQPYMSGCTGSLAAKLSRLKRSNKTDVTEIEKHQPLRLDNVPTGSIPQERFVSQQNKDIVVAHASNSLTDKMFTSAVDSQMDVTQRSNQNIPEAAANEGCQNAPLSVLEDCFFSESNGKIISVPSDTEGATRSHNCENITEVLFCMNKKEESGNDLKDTLIGESEVMATSSTTNSDWIEHLDTSLGRMVYINMVTGLSKYEAPIEEAKFECLKDLTTTKVQCVSNKGIQYECYPFKTDIIIPFLPKEGPKRARCEEDSRAKADHPDSIHALLSEWENPVFPRHPEVAVDVSCGQAPGLAVKIHNFLFPYRFTKQMMTSVKVVQQVDSKFIACLFNTGTGLDSDKEANLLVLVDQHAADERIRLEMLIADSYEAHTDASGQKTLCTSSVYPPLELDLSEEDLRLLRSCHSFLRLLGLDVSFAKNGSSRIFVGKVPVCFIEREANELRRGRRTITKLLVEEYVRELIELICSTGRLRGTLPLTVLKVLASQACHGAVKFNDPLTREECCQLIRSLSVCQLPFQCAHGRPSIIPLADLDHLETDEQDLPKPNLLKLRQKYEEWLLHGKKL
ncbi:DNA mismatch repair protein Mlh3 [Polypterus senegalus]|uniref:DNA mismatch repair protein Mlh3 n=1 Tax=Polypterus senegalus TaxID=55291 RepID=UPI0019651FEA|nr:DNA mismatch repair protein Mlh3 [Polypterus senegalus]